MQYDWLKYKRVFAFGCSFTHCWYPTWADIIFNETKNSTCYNFGKAGMGNLAISARIAEANVKFKFNETDLVLVMYTSLFREDRWLEGKWQAHGCIYNQPYYDPNFVKNYVDPIGCLIRDLSLIEMSSSYVRSLSCDNLILLSSDVHDDGTIFSNEYMTTAPNVISHYSSTLESFPLSLKETLFPNGWVTRRTHIKGNKINEDDHPLPSDYYDYLSTIGLNLSEDTALYIDRVTSILNQNLHQADCVFEELSDSRQHRLF